MKKLLFTLVVVAATAVNAQCPTVESIVRGKEKSKDNYNVSAQSRTASILPGKEYEMSFIAQPGMDYRLAAKLAPGGTGTITYEVYELTIEKKTEGGKTVYDRKKHVLATSGDAQSGALEFSTDKARKIFVSVSLSGGDKKNPECVGVMIEDKKSTKIGF